MRPQELSTPALAIDLETVERNLEVMARVCQKQGVGLRPHTKTHKTPEVARLQLSVAPSDSRWPKWGKRK